MGLNKFFLDNRMFDASMVYAASSEEGQLPAEHLRDQLRQAVWQTQGPFVITDHNNKIDFNRGGVKVATVANGTYATGTALCTAIVTALNTADPPFGGLTWASDYNVAGANLFRIRNTAGAPVGFDLLWNSGTNKYRSMGIDLGFTVSADSGSVTTQTASSVSYQSRHFLVWTQSDGSTISASTAVLCQHNFVGGAAGDAEITIQGNATDVWSAPSFSETFALLNTAHPAVDPCPLVFATAQSRVYWRLVIDDVQNQDGFAQLGILFLGNTTSPSVCCSESLAFTQEDFSQRADSISGAGFVSQEPDREAFPLEYTDIPNGGSDETKIDTLRDQPVGLNFFFQFDDTDVLTLFYACKVSGARKQCVAGGSYWTYDIPLVEQV